MGGSNPFLFDAVENRVVDVIGTGLVFPLAEKYVKNVVLPSVDVARSETLISLPTRGVFGEAKLGHCNSAEVIDNTRFWDWKTSPCPDEAPAITGVSPQGLGTPTVPAPTPLPASTLSIATPASEPDPIGLRAALDVLKTPGIFNNMSGIQQLQGLLGSLSDAAAKVATAKKPDQGASDGGLGAAAQGQGAKGPGAPSAGTGGGGAPQAGGTSGGTPGDGGQPATGDGGPAASGPTTPSTERRFEIAKLLRFGRRKGASRVHSWRCRGSHEADRFAGPDRAAEPRVGLVRHSRTCRPEKLVDKRLTLVDKFFRQHHPIV